MTVLHQYSRLEAAGLWRSDPKAQARDVVVGLRKATIVLLDPKSEMPLTQWSLPAIHRLSQAEGRVTYTPHPDGYETLEIDDAAMIAALDRVRAVLDRRRKKPGRLRSVAVAASLVLTLGAMAAWVPLRLFDFAAQRLPDAVRRDVSAMVLADMAVISGSPCARPSGLQAAQLLAQRLHFVPTEPPAQAPTPPARIMVLRSGLALPIALPDGTVLLPYPMVEAVDDPDSLAGLVLTARLASRTTDPMQSALRYAGILATFRLLSSGALPEGALQGYGLYLASQPAPPVDDRALSLAFAELQITAQPYAHFRQDQAIAAKPGLTSQASIPPVLDDAAFLAMQYICDP